MNTLSRLAFALALPLLATPAPAEDRNGLSVLVTKTTLDKKDSRTSSYYERSNKTQALKVTVKNISFKPMPEGEMTWKILVVGTYSSTLYTGVEKVNALKPAESVEFILGSAQISGRQGSSWADKDKTEWQIIITQGAPS